MKAFFVLWLSKGLENVCVLVIFVKRFFCYFL